MFFVSCFCAWFLCWFFWPGPAISMACLRRLSEFGHARGELGTFGEHQGSNRCRCDRNDGTAKKRRSEDREKARPTTAITLTTTYWRRTGCTDFTFFLLIFFGFVNNENRAENDFLKSELSSDLRFSFISRTHQKEIKRLNLSMEGGINGSIDCFFSVSLSIVPCVDVNSFQVAHPSLDLTLWLFWKIITVNSSVI